MWIILPSSVINIVCLSFTTRSSESSSPIMPRVHTRYIAALKNPVEQTFFQDKTGALIYCNIYTEVGTDKELVQCEVCNLYFPLQGDRSTSNLRIHWGSVECGKEKERRKTEKLLNEERRQAELALQMAFGPLAPSGSSSHPSQFLDNPHSLKRDVRSININNLLGVKAALTYQSTAAAYV